jgi:hypothetical protein
MAKLKVVARDASVPDTESMPLARLPVTELAVDVVPSTRKVIDDVDEFPELPEFPGAVGLVPPPPPHPIVAAARHAAIANTHRAAIRIRCPVSRG